MTSIATTEQKQLSPVDRVKNVLAMDTVKEQFQNALAENSNAFVASIIELVASDTNLQKCEPKLVVMEALKAATLKLPINKALGFAYVVPYNKKIKVGNKWDSVQIPTFQLGYKGFVQLAMRTGQYRRLNDGIVYEGQFRKQDPLTGEIDISGAPTSDEIAGYFAFFELLNGFSKVLYMSVGEVTKHAERYSKSFSYDNSPWKSNFDSMAIKTCWRRLLSKYGIMSVEMENALAAEEVPQFSPAGQLESDIAQYANQEVIDIQPDGQVVDTQTGEILGGVAGEPRQPENDPAMSKGPGF